MFVIFVSFATVFPSMVSSESGKTTDVMDVFFSSAPLFEVFRTTPQSAATPVRSRSPDPAT